MEFKDYFSAQAKEYSKYRPKYPDELFKYLSSLTKEHDLAWDCACGNGQASVGLAEYHKKVIATDASQSQISNAIPNAKVTYMTAPAENSGLESHIADIITVATAIHWLDTDKFYAEVNRVLKAGGIIAIWNYAHSRISPEIDRITDVFTNKTLRPYWPKENIKAWNFEETIKFPFKRINTPEFNMIAEWNLTEFLSYMSTWSAVQKYVKMNDSNPIDKIKDRLKKLWGDESSIKKITWKLNMKAGMV